MSAIPDTIIRISEANNHVEYVDASGTPLDLGALANWLTLANCEPLPTRRLFDWARMSPTILVTAATRAPTVTLSYRPVMNRSAVGSLARGQMPVTTTIGCSSRGVDDSA